MAYKPKRKPNLDRSLHILAGGDEPVVSKGENYKTQLMRALNWYNANRDEKEHRAYAEYYIKHSPELKQYLYAVQKAGFLEIKAVGVVGRLLRREQHVDIKDSLKILETLETLSQKYKKGPSQERIADKAAAQPTPSIQDRILEQARTHAAEVDGQIDEFVLTKQNSFSMKSYLLGNQVSGVVSKKIASFYEKQLKELQEAYAGKDAALKEGYSNFSRVHLRKLIEFVQQIIADCSQQVVSAKAQRKPRARKVKPPSVVAAKIKPMREYAELKLKSIDPAKIIGSDELWVYTPSTRKLTVFRSADGPLGVSGMSVTNFDVEKSETKTLRKPDEFFKGLSSTGKRAMANAWKAIRAKSSKPRARINNEMILLAAN